MRDFEFNDEQLVSKSSQAFDKIVEFMESEEDI
jgi:hypothetical protein